MGVDGARGGWVAATREGVRGFERFRDVAAAYPDARLYVDIPVGLLSRGASGYRPCDREAKRALGPRGASVFVPPLRRQLALAGRPFRAGLHLSAQSFGLLPKIREVEAFCEDPRVREAHPELAFLLANGGRPLPPKRPASLGRPPRARILRRLGFLHDAAGALGVGAKRDDVDDASILAWMGGQAEAGRVEAYGEPPLVIWGRPRETRSARASRGPSARARE